MVNKVFVDKIGIIGTGNVAWHLCRLFSIAGVEVSGILVRNSLRAAAKSLDKMFNVPLEDDLQRLMANSTMLIIAVSDDQIPVIAANLSDFKGLVCHTSGSVSLEMLSSSVPKAGVLYPLQTLTRGNAVAANQIPLCLEAVMKEDLEKLNLLAQTIGCQSYPISSIQRLQLHIAAVFACNFTHHLVCNAYDLLQKHHLDPAVMLPLIKENSLKLFASDLHGSQTGPARRGDTETLRKHLAELDDRPELKEIYRLLSQSILNKYQKD